MPTILLVEDDLSLRETLAYNLRKQDYRVETASDGGAAVELARRLHPALDLVVLDIMLPVLDGFEVCRILRQEMNVTIIMLTARDDEIDRVLGLEIGADDYITKPFSMREFLARVKAHLRRERLVRAELAQPPASASAPAPNQLLTFGNLTIDLTRQETLLEGQPLALKPQEYTLLLFLARHRGQALSRQRLLEQVWGWEYGVNTRTVDVHVRWLRQKIEPDPALPTRIITVRGSGYRFEG
jgi:DNA-binding response OmpR family regulator